MLDASAPPPPSPTPLPPSPTPLLPLRPPDMPEDIIRGSISYRDPMEELSNPLPPGWVEVEDDDGRIYFFHERSGETTWNRPRDRFVSTPL